MQAMDKVTEEVEKVKKEWDETCRKTQEHITEIAQYGRSGRPNDQEQNSLPRLNAIAQDGLALLSSLIFKLDLLAPQLPTDSEVQSARNSLESWKTLIQTLRLNLRNANMQAKANMRKAAQEERALLLGGGEESTARRRNLQTKAGMTSAAESITESLRRTRQLMAQEVERSTSTLMTLGGLYVRVKKKVKGKVFRVSSDHTVLRNMIMSSVNNSVLEICFAKLFRYIDESTGVLRKAESEYKGHRSLLMRTRNLLSTMQRQDVLDRIIMAVGFLLFSLAVLYVVSKRIGLLTLQRKVTEAIKAGMAGKAELRPQDIVDKININHVRNMEAPIDQRIHDEL
ncbi:hypothetical protein Ahy_B04g069748 isoform A [Arachis hypogaea]|uniref:Sec20 C-terminal domain-containing protein n=2 Tax=Arachis hypogaea TaxID=3818 RepID=A0A444ZDG7_ARAHY|nr:hypothetical protein Ahy_B04g069748 isoform A [Arachis hypogaea]